MSTTATRRHWRWFADRRVNTKLLIMLSALLLVAGAVGVAAAVQLGTVADAADSLYEDGAVPLETLAEARQANGDMRQRVLLHLAGPASDKAARERQIAELDATVDERLATFGETFADERLLQDYRDAIRTYREFRWLRSLLRPLGRRS